mgnify:CR=1 FL=1
MVHIMALIAMVLCTKIQNLRLETRKLKKMTTITQKKMEHFL